MILCSLLVSSLTALHAQQGAITYQRKVDVHRRMEDEQMKAMLPQFRTTQHILLFSDSISVYKAIKEEEAPDPFDQDNGGARVVIRMGPGEGSVIYKNFSRQLLQEQTELADKNYIIDDSIRLQPWKLAEETKNILGHNCKKATLTTRNGSNVTAWYAEDIATPAGPENFGGLPGAILLLDMNEGEVVFSAAAIEQKVNSKELALPKDGQHITRADFQKKMDELFGPPGPGGRRMIRM